MTDNQPKMPEPGAAGRRLSEAVAGLRQARGLSQRRLSARLAALGRPLIPLAVSRLERGERRTDVDDLLALAVALGVNPSALLLPRHVPPGTVVELTPACRVPAGDAWAWADGSRPLPAEGDEDTGRAWERAADFQRHARPDGGTAGRPLQVPVMLAAIDDLMARWELAYRDWADPGSYEARASALRRAWKRLELTAEDELDRLEREGRAAAGRGGGRAGGQ